MTYLDDIAQRVRGAVSPETGVPASADDLFRIYALLSLTKGADVTERDVHNAWVLWMTQRGEAHEDLVPFEQLSAGDRDKDLPFAAAIRAVAAQLSEEANDARSKE